MIRTPLNRKPEGTLVLARTFAQWSAGTRVEFIEYCDYAEGVPNTVLGRIRNEQLTIPIADLVERRL